jgi:hypothetical protein
VQLMTPGTTGTPACTTANLEYITRERVSSEPHHTSSTYNTKWWVTAAGTALLPLLHPVGRAKCTRLQQWGTPTPGQCAWVLLLLLFLLGRHDKASSPPALQC